MTARSNRAQRGVVLIIVITVLMALIIVAVPFAMNMRAARRTSVAWVQQEQARIAAHGAASYAANILQASSQAHDTSPLYDDEDEFAVRAYTFLRQPLPTNAPRIPVEDASGFPDAGFIRIDDEWIKYGVIPPGTNEFTACTRGALNTEAKRHKKYAEVSVAPRGVRWDIKVTDEHSRININTLTPDGFAHVMRLPLYEFYVNKVAKSPTELPTLVVTLDAVSPTVRVTNVNPDAIFTDKYGETVDGFLCIDDEWIAYRAVLGLDDGDNEVTFVGCSRGIRGTAAAAHDSGRTVFIEFPLPVARLTKDLPPGATTAAIDDVDSLASGRGTRDPRHYRPGQPIPFPMAFGWLRIRDEWLTYYRVTPNIADDDISVRGGLRPGVAVEIRRNQVEQRQNLNARHPAQEPVRVPPYPLPTYLVSDAPIPASGGATVKVKDATWFPPQGFVNIDGEVIYYSNLLISRDDPPNNALESAFARWRRNYGEFALEIPAAGRGLRGTQAAEHLPGAPVYPALYVEQFLSQPFDSVEQMRNPSRKAFLFADATDPTPYPVVDTSTNSIRLQRDDRTAYFPDPRANEIAVVQLGSELMKYTGIDVRNVAGRPVVELVVAERGAFGTSPAVHTSPGALRYLFTYNTGRNKADDDLRPRTDEQPGMDDLLVDQMENIPPAVFDQIRPHVTIASLPEGPREVPVMLATTPNPRDVMIYHDGTVPLLPWRAWLFFPNGENRVITELGLGYLTEDVSQQGTFVPIMDSSSFPQSGRAQIGGREWVTYRDKTDRPTHRITQCAGLLDHSQGDVVVPDPLYVSWQNAIQWGGYAPSPTPGPYDSATLRMTNPAKVNINTADAAVIMAVAATARGVQSALSIADVASIAEAVTARLEADPPAPIEDAKDFLNTLDLGIPEQKKWLFARWFRSAFAIKNKGAFRVEATGTVKGSRRETAASYTTTQIVQVPDIVPAQATTPAPISIDTQDYFVDWASAKNALPDGTSHLAIIGTTTDSAVPSEMVHGLDAAGIPSEDPNGYAAAQPAPIPQENDPATTFLANYGLSLGIMGDSAPYDADGPTRGRMSAARDRSLTLPPPTPTPSADDVFPEGLNCRERGFAYFTDYRSTADGHRSIEADGRNATLAPMAIEMWVKPSEAWWATPTPTPLPTPNRYYLFDLHGGPPPSPVPTPTPPPSYQNRISLYQETRYDGSNLSLHLVLDVADTVPGWHARFDMPIDSAAPLPTPLPAGLPWEAGKWYYVAAVVAGTEPGEMAILVTDPGADVGLSPLAAYGMYGIYKGDVANPDPGYSYLITDMARFEDYDSGDEITVHGFFEDVDGPPYVMIGGTSYHVKSISPAPSSPAVVRDWVLTLDEVPSPSPTPTSGNTKVPLGMWVPPEPALPPPSYFQRTPSSGHEVLLLFHTHSLPTPTPTPTPRPNLNWEVQEILAGRAITDTTPDPDDQDPTKMWVRLDSHGGWTDERLEGKPKLVLDDALSGDMPAKVPGTLDPPYEHSFFTVGINADADATRPKPGQCVIDDLKITRLNPTANDRTAHAPSRVVPTPSAPPPATAPNAWVEGAQGWPGPTPLRARSWLLAPNRSGNGARVLFAKSAVPSPTPTPLPSATPYPLDVEGGATPRPGESVTPLSFIDVAIVSGAPTQVGNPPAFLEVPLDDSVGFPASGFVVRQSPQLSWYGLPSGYGILGHVRPLSDENGFLLWVPAYGAYGTDSGRPGPRDILTEIPIRYWDRFPERNTTSAPGYEWVREVAPALVFRARKRLPGGYLERFTWEYYNPGGDPDELPSELQRYANVYTELFLDGQRVYHPEAGTQLGYYETPLDSATKPWEINRKFDEIEVRAYFDYTGTVLDNAFTSGACNIAPKIDKFILYLRQPVSTTMVIPGEP